VKRLDHHGVVASVIDDLKLVDIIDERIPPDGQEEVTTGEAAKAMIQNGLGFANRPLMLTPHFLKTCPWTSCSEPVCKQNTSIATNSVGPWIKCSTTGVICCLAKSP
jgi:hypothetical protein